MDENQTSPSRTDIIKHAIGTCPRCRVAIYSEVTVTTTLLASRLALAPKSRDRVTIEPRTTSTMESCLIEHECDKDKDRDDEDLDEDDDEDFLDSEVGAWER